MSRNPDPARPTNSVIAQQTFQADFACVACAESAERTVRSHAGIADAQVHYAGRKVEVSYDPALIDAPTIERLVARSAYDCRCADQDMEAHGGGLVSLAHKADMAAITQGTTADRMQYEFPSTHAGKQHQDEVHADHAARGHDMSDPRMAKVMEADMRNRFFVAFVLTVVILLFSPLATNIFGLKLLPVQAANWVMLVLSIPVVWWAGWPFIGGAVTSLRHRALNMSVLIATGVLAAWGFSLLITVLGRGETFYDAAAMLVTFVLFGHWMEMKSRRGTTDALRALFDLVPPAATVLRDGTEQQVPTSEIVVGNLVRLRPGDKVPVDGEVVEGTTSIDESLVTGESVPVEKGPGESVIGGSINRAGSVVMKTTKVGSDTALGQIISLVQEAQSSKAPGQRLADQAASYLVVVAIGSGIFTFLAWYFVGGTTVLRALTFAISAVVIACPDALGLATPTAVAVGVGIGARHNILIKDAATLEGLASINAIVLDKTGTLTEGRPRLTDVILVSLNGHASLTQDDLLHLVGSAEQGSEHPLATAIVEGARDRGVSLVDAQDFRAVPGKGLTARVNDHQVVAGNEALLTDHNIALGQLQEQASALATQGKTPMYVAVDGNAAGVVAVADTIKPSARLLISQLRIDGIEAVMMTGDNRRTADAAARELGIERVFAEVLPEQKASYVRTLQGEGKRVAMVGDGVNDAPALAQSDIGIAIGTGTDVAIETADVVLMKSDPYDIIRALKLSRATVTKMKQNLAWASVYNLLAIPVAAGALYPRFGIMLAPEWSALLMSLSSIIVATNAVLLKRVDAVMGPEQERGAGPAPTTRGPRQPAEGTMIYESSADMRQQDLVRSVRQQSRPSAASLSILSGSGRADAVMRSFNRLSNGLNILRSEGS